LPLDLQVCTSTRVSETRSTFQGLRSSRHVIQQPHKTDLKSQLTLMTTALVKKCLHAMRSATKQTRGSTKILEQQYSLVVVWSLNPNHLVPIESPSSFYSPSGMLCGFASIGWYRTQNNLLSCSMLLDFLLETPTTLCQLSLPYTSFYPTLLHFYFALAQTLFALSIVKTAEYAETCKNSLVWLPGTPFL